MVYLVLLVITVATVASATRLVRTDVITAPWRVKIRNWSGPHGFWTDMLECFRCTAVWVSPLITGFYGALGLVFADAGWLGWLLAALAWVPASFGISYLAYLMFLLEGID